MKKKRLTPLLVVCFWLLLWQAISMLVSKPVIFASPLATAQALWQRLPTLSFWLAALSSLWRIALGFALAFLAGVGTGILAFRLPLLKTLLSPLLSLMKSVPVASFVILALVWFGSPLLSVVVVFVIDFPLLYFATLSGLGSADAKLLELAQVFRVPALRRAWGIYRPALLPYLLTACSSALGMSWKAGIAAEVIGTPAHSIGEQLYYAKVYYITADLFAWTLVVIVLSMVFERLVMYILRKAGGKHGHHRSIG